MAITYKVFLDERRQKTDKTYPLKIRVTVNRKHKEVHLNYSILKEDWDNINQRVKPSNSSYNDIQFAISKKLIELQGNTSWFEKQGKNASIEDIVTPTIQKHLSYTFLSFANEQIENMIKMGRIGNSMAYKSAISKLEKFIGTKEVRFEDMNYKFLEDFTIYMIGDGLKVNAISCYMREIRAIYNKAIKRELVEPKYYPFLKYKIKSEKTINRTLTIDELKSIVNISLPDKGDLKVYQALFSLSFCLIGTNFADLVSIKAENIINDRLIFHRKKTKKTYSIKIHSKAKELLDYLQTKRINKGSYLLPFINSRDSPMKQKKDTALITHATNENLKKIATSVGINKPVSTYYARYSWANIAKSLGYSKDLIAEGLGHEYGNKITGIYLDDFDKELIDDMNAKIIDKIFIKDGLK